MSASVQPPNHSSALPSGPPEAWEPLRRLARFASKPIERFLGIEASSGLVLLAAAIVALVWANSRWADSYVRLWHAPLGITIGGWSFERTLEWFVNDGLMVIFFFVVGLEIRREIHHGELSQWRRATLPVAAALGGMLVPAGLYLVIANGGIVRSGWGVPMATDIAFAVGILTLLGSRVPAALRVLLLALAVIDDLGAILVIAIFYSSGIGLMGLLVAALGFLGVFALQRFGVRSKIAYIVPAFVVWMGIDAAGVHPTIAGVIVGLVTPVRAWLGPDGFMIGVREQLDQLAEASPRNLSSPELAEALRHVDAARREAMSPAENLIEALHPWVAYGIMPVFALANAGVHLSGGAGGSLDDTSWLVVIGVGVGLVVGKPVGVLLAMWCALKLRWASLPQGITARHLVALGMVAGVGFTMALFISQLAFTDPRLLSAGKLGVLGASGIAAVGALTWGWLLLPKTEPAASTQT